MQVEISASAHQMAGSARAISEAAAQQVMDVVPGAMAQLRSIVLETETALSALAANASTKPDCELLVDGAIAALDGMVEGRASAAKAGLAKVVDDTNGLLTGIVACTAAAAAVPRSTKVSSHHAHCEEVSVYV
jgi:hypothetical protein